MKDIFAVVFEHQLFALSLNSKFNTVFLHGNFGIEK